MPDSQQTINARFWMRDPIYEHMLGVELNQLRTSPEKQASALITKRSLRNSSYSIGVAGCEALLHKAKIVGIHRCFIVMLPENGVRDEVVHSAIGILGQITLQDLIGGNQRDPKKGGGFFSDYWWLSEDGKVQRRNRGNFVPREPSRAERVIEQINQLTAGEAA